MKKVILLFGGLLFLPFFIFAQRVELTPFGGYVFASKMYASNGNVRFLGNAQYGAILSVAVSRVCDVDLIYNRSDTKAEINVSDYPYKQVPLSINYMQIGFTKNFRVHPKVSPFVGFNLGACLMAPKEDYYDAWFFSMGLNAGAKIYLSNHFGLRLQAQGLFPVEGSGYSFFVGTGGTGGGVSLYSSMIQFGLTGSLIFRIGSVSP